MFGSLIYPTGYGLYTIHERKRHLEVKAHLEQLIGSDPKGFYFVSIDNASAHTTPMLDDFWRAHLKILEPVFLETYSPHLSLIERLWGLMRGQMTQNHFYEKIESLCQAVVGWLEK
ncbi:transposase [Candidatus Poribacteria bacterium]|nr:transposase [Candidatus Poribacteria bacterium]